MIDLETRQEVYRLEQATMIFGVDDLVREHMDAKIERLRERVRQNMSRGMRGQE